MRAQRSVLAAATLVAAAVGCGSRSMSQGDALGTDGCDARQILLVNCSGCHDGVSKTTGFLDLTAPEAIAGLVGQPASGPRCAASGAILINADGSGLFVDKLRSPPPCGEQMPQATFPLSSEEIACVASWVAMLAAGSDGGSPEGDATIEPDAVAEDAPEQDADDADDADGPFAGCFSPGGEITNAACNDVVASGPCVAPLMMDSEPPGAQGGALVPGTYDLTERTLFTYAGGATGPAGEPLAETIALSGSGTEWSLAVADLTAATSTRQTLMLTLVGSSGQLRTALICPGADEADGGTDAGAAGGGTLYFTAGGGALTLYRFGSSGPVRADTYVMR